MNKPYIFGHRGAMGYSIENTIQSFQKAIEMKVGIETDVHLTKDKTLVCFHDSVFKIGTKGHSIRDLTLKELKEFKFKDGREIPTLEEVFDTFSYCPNSLRYSCDIENKETGLRLIDTIKKYSYFNRVEITDLRLSLLIKLREYNKNIKLVYTLNPNITKINDKTIKFDILRNNNINTLNIKVNRINVANFNIIIDSGFQCYVWDVNSKHHMKKVLKLKKNGECVGALYTNYPDILKMLRDKIYSL
jgi:glycerophosphoryl diester phosphodiesterase